jgi:hypothetical protein
MEIDAALTPEMDAGVLAAQEAERAAAELKELVAAQQRYLKIIASYEADPKVVSWLNRSETIEKLYSAQEDSSKDKQAYPVLWAVTQTMSPAIYSRSPKCVVARRHQEASPNIKAAVMGQERAVNFEIERGGLHEAILNARLDRLLAGRGTIWVRLNKDPATGRPGVAFDYVAVKDFGHGKARTWADIDCVWRRHYMSDAERRTQFGDDAVNAASVSNDVENEAGQLADEQASVYEIWCKSERKVYWIAKQARAALRVTPAPLELADFFPCPRPLYGVLINKRLVPTPDYTFYEGLARQINKLTKRVDVLSGQLRLVGFYPKGPDQDGSGAIESALRSEVDNVMIPVPNWAAFSERGGSKAIEYLPIEMVLTIIDGCTKLRASLLAEVDQITGISDIMRGQTDANETLGAQQLKAQYGSSRLSDTREDFKRFARDACRIAAEMISEYFPPEELGRITGLPALAEPDPENPMLPPQIAPWVQILRQQFAREVSIDIETDSTIQPDEDAEKQRRIEMLTAVTSGLKEMSALLTAPPEIGAAMLPLMGDMLKFTIGGFRAGRELEERLEETIASLTRVAQQAATAQAVPQALQTAPLGGQQVV